MPGRHGKVGYRFGVTPLTDAPLPILDLPDERIPMSDGVRLAARIWRPDGRGPVPAILEFIPYRKGDGTRQRDERMHPWWAARGYACLRVDLRGAGDSEGLLEDEYTAQELQDACDIIAWAAGQSWCSGRVGMMGKSWGGFNCLQTAASCSPRRLTGGDLSLFHHGPFCRRHPLQRRSFAWGRTSAGVR